MIVACSACDQRYDASGQAIGTQFRCRCGASISVSAAAGQAALLSCPQCGAGVAATASQCAHCGEHLLMKGCPRCLSRVFHGHKHCPECGSELAVAALGDTASQRRLCPRCENTLAARRVDDLVIDECGGCYGLFLDQVAIKRIVTDRQQARADAVLGALPIVDTPQVNGPPGTRLYVKCPVCRVVMNRRLFASGSGIIVDVCRSHGTFFDGGELPRVIQFVMNGGIEQAHRKDMEREREQIRLAHSKAQLATAFAHAHSGPPPGQPTVGAGGALVSLLAELFRH